MSKKKFGFAIAVFVLLLMGGASEVMAQGFYELGPYTVYGIGDDEAQSQENAILEMQDKIAEVAATLPVTHMIIGTPIDDEYQWMATIYVIEFRIVVLTGLPIFPGGTGVYWLP